jgi:hypothetical protein
LDRRTIPDEAVGGMPPNSESLIHQKIYELLVQDQFIPDVETTTLICYWTKFFKYSSSFKYVFALMGRFQLELIYLCFPLPFHQDRNNNCLMEGWWKIQVN